MRKYLLLSIIPIIYIFIFLLFRYSEGPFYYDFLYDPSYVYLISSLNLTQGYGVAHIDHPGTPIQIIGAVVIKILYLAFGSANDISSSVLSTPESYLNSIYIVLISVNSLGIFLMGIIIFKTIKNFLGVFLFQLSPLICFPAFRRLSQISSEIFLIFVIVLLISFLIKFIYEENISFKKMNYYMIVFGILCGLAIVTKISAVTFLIIPFFLIRGVFRKLFFLILALLTFLIILYPVVNNPQIFIDYVYNTVFKSGRYGIGESNIVNTSIYVKNFIQIISSEILLDVIIVLLISSLIFSFINQKKYIENNHLKERKLLFLIFLSIGFNLILISKNFYSHYLLPSLMLIGSSIYLIISLFYDQLFLKKNLNKVYILTICILLIIISYKSIQFYNYSSFKYKESEKFVNFLNYNNNNTLFIYSLGISNQYTALMYSSLYTGTNVKSNLMLKQKISEFLFYNVFKGKLQYIANSASIEDKEKIKQILLSSNKILYCKRQYVTPFETNDTLLKILKTQYGFNEPRLENVFSNKNNESVYEVILR